MMDALGRNVDRILEIIESDLKDILWNGKTSTENWLGDYRITTEVRGDSITIEVKPRGTPCGAT